MIPSLELVVFLLGLASGVVSGLLGIGGAIIIVPALLYIPQWLGIGAIGIKTAAAIAVCQVVAASLTGAIAHSRHGLIHGRLGVVMSVAAASGALTGGIVSAYLPGEVLLLVAAVLATSAAGVMVLPASRRSPEGPSHPAFNVLVVFPAGFGIGLLIGTIGIGSFLMVPTLIFLCKVPTRIAMATVLAVAFPTSAAALIGKVATNQVPLLPGIAIVIGAVPGAQLGSMLSVRLPARVLRLLYGALILVVAFGLWYDVLNTPSV